VTGEERAERNWSADSRWIAYTRAVMAYRGADF
jgi:hypothetical protein